MITPERFRELDGLEAEPSDRPTTYEIGYEPPGPERGRGRMLSDLCADGCHVWESAGGGLEVCMVREIERWAAADDANDGAERG